jgi:hypothetical protein
LKHNQGGDRELSKFFKGDKKEREDGIGSSQHNWEVDVWNLVKVMKILLS